MADESWMALFAAVVIALVAGAIFWLIKFAVDNEERNDDLQRQCIAAGGNWSYGCDMKP